MKGKNIMNYKVDMGKRMKEKRKSLLLTQEQMAEKLNISIKHYGAAERGMTGLSIENLIEVSEILGIDLDYLIKGTPVESQNIPSRIKEIYLNCPEDKKKYLLELFELSTKF